MSPSPAPTTPAVVARRQWHTFQQWQWTGLVPLLQTDLELFKGMSGFAVMPHWWLLPTNCNSIAPLSRSISSWWPQAQLYSWPRLDDITLGVFWGLLGLRGARLVYHDMSALSVNQTLPWVVPVGVLEEDWFPLEAQYISTHCLTEALLLYEQYNEKLTCVMMSNIWFLVEITRKASVNIKHA